MLTIVQDDFSHVEHIKVLHLFAMFRCSPLVTSINALKLNSSVVMCCNFFSSRVGVHSCVIL